jgi:AAA domain-containing protein
MAKVKKTKTRPETAERLDAVRKKIRRASEIEEAARILAFGRSGSGKTRLSATAPNVLLIDVNEKGTASVRRDYDPNVFPAEFWSDVIDVYWFLANGDHDFDSYSIDGATSMQNLCMKFVLGDEASRDASRDPDMASRAVWGKVGELMKTQITNFRNLPMHGVFTALQRSRSTGEDEEEGEIVISPACSPAIAGHLEAAVDIIGHLHTKEVILKKKGSNKRRKSVRRRLMVGPSERYLTKERYGVFGDFIDQPNIRDMLEIIYEEE